MEKAWLFSFLPQDGAIGMSSGMKGPLSRMPAPCLYSLIQRDQKTAAGFERRPGTGRSQAQLGSLRYTSTLWWGQRDTAQRPKPLEFQPQGAAQVSSSGAAATMSSPFTTQRESLTLGGNSRWDNDAYFELNYFNTINHHVRILPLNILACCLKPAMISSGGIFHAALDQASHEIIMILETRLFFFCPWPVCTWPFLLLPTYRPAARPLWVYPRKELWRSGLHNNFQVKLALFGKIIQTCVVFLPSSVHLVHFTLHLSSLPPWDNKTVQAGPVLTGSHWPTSLRGKQCLSLQRPHLWFTFLLAQTGSWVHL